MHGGKRGRRAQQCRERPLEVDVRVGPLSLVQPLLGIHPIQEAAKVGPEEEQWDGQGKQVAGRGVVEPLAPRDAEVDEEKREERGGEGGGYSLRDGESE